MTAAAARTFHLVSAVLPFVEVLARYSKTLPAMTVPVRGHSRRPASNPPRLHAARRRLSPDSRAQLAADYRAGRSTTWLMQNYRLGKGTVLNILEQECVQMRGQGIPDDRLDEVIRLYRSRQSLVRLSTQFECSAETVRQALLAAGITLRKQWDRGSTT
jgi:hypothetical protein